MRKDRHIDPAIVDQQQVFVRDIAGRGDKPQSYHIVTYGCQMNAHDSESLSGMLRQMGMRQSENLKEADLVLYNTCCIRDNAQRRALGNVTWLKELKKEKPELVICVSGCMVQQEGIAELMQEKYPFVDVAFGTHNLYRLPELLHRALTTGRQVVEVLPEEGSIAEDLPVQRARPFHAYLTIMYGCNNYCSYCIVPFVRGRERSRRMLDILREAEALRDDGVQEIMLLGQNVNSYGLDSGEATFAELLRALDTVGIPRIRFMTSHPKDLSDALIETMAGGQHICPAFHLPVQSGNDRILSEMNRKYTRAHYLDRLAALRAAVPGISVTSDIIVAYPGETEAEFRDTLSLVEEAQFDAAFTFIFSPRDGTRAAELPGQIPPEEATERIERLIALQKDITTRQMRRFLDTDQQVLVEEASRRDARQIAGKTPTAIHVNFPGEQSRIGQFVTVHIDSAGENTLRGHANQA